MRARARSIVTATLFAVAALSTASRAEGGWRAEFDAICARTQDALALPVAELETLVARCDALAPEIEKLDETQRKVFTRRLKACRDLYRFVLETRTKASG
jgi:hypothetical protein